MIRKRVNLELWKSTELLSSVDLDVKTSKYKESFKIKITKNIPI